MLVEKSNPWLIFVCLFQVFQQRQNHRSDTDAAQRNRQILIRRCFTRVKLIEYLARLPQTTIGMEACPGCHWLARKAKSFGHTPCIVPAQFVKPFVKSNKNDLIDAEAIAEAISRPTMRTVIRRYCSLGSNLFCLFSTNILTHPFPGGVRYQGSHW